MDRSIFSQLRRTDVALTGKNKSQPIILFRFNRWHLINVGILVDSRMKPARGIVTVHFMSNYRARKTIKEWYPYSEITSFDAICPAFREELSAKVLPDAENYRLLIQKGWVELSCGYTTDTLFKVTDKSGNQDILISAIGEWMEKGEMGPFLHFKQTCDVFQPG